MISIIIAILDPWCWKMAWRDSKANRSRFLLFLLVISLGVAALVALRSFGDVVTHSIKNQNRELLGADLVLRSRKPIPKNIIEKVSSQSRNHAREWRFGSMVRFIGKSPAPRLIQVRGIESQYPLYGNIATTPLEAAKNLHNGDNSAIIEEILLHQYGTKIGDKIQLGEQEFKIIGVLKSIPGESVIAAEMAPRILIPFTAIEKTKLINFGSRVSYRHNFLYKDKTAEEPLIEMLKTQESLASLRYETVNSREQRLDKTLKNIFQFLNLTALIALLLGGIGIGNAVHVYIKSKLRNVAILRCIGSPIDKTFSIYLIQAIILGIVGSLLGVIIGLIIQLFLPTIIGDFLPIEIANSLSWPAIILGVLSGLTTTIAFSLPPLLKVRKITPLDSLRLRSENATTKDYSAYFIYALLAVVIVGFSIFSATNTKTGFLMAMALFATLIALAIVAKFAMFIVQISLPRLLPFPIRQGLNNLYRPQNQTLILTLSLGTGTFLIALLYLAQANILHQVDKTANGTNPNMVLFDIQYEQTQQIKKLLTENNYPIIQESPIVAMRLKAINGQKVEELLKKNSSLPKEKRLAKWALTRDYRSSYREKLAETERLLPGDQFTGTVNPETIFDKPVPISVATRLLERLKLKLGDKLLFDVDGLTIETIIDSRRDVEWMQMRPNFFIIFPKGVLEDAPQMSVIATKTQNPPDSAQLQNLIAKELPNISSIDLSLVLNTVKNILDKAGFAIKFMAGFALFTGLVILICSLQLSQLQRLRENALLKVIGARKAQMRTVLISEFSFLAILSANSGTGLAYLANEIIAQKVFESSAPLNFSVLLFANAILIFLTIAIGLISCQKLYRKTSLSILQTE